MFTGIVEALGVVENIVSEKENLHLTLSCPFTSELKIDQSLSHNGVCLTVTKIKGSLYDVTAIKETLEKSNLKTLQKNDKVNLERCMKLGERLDGHLVQGHIDQVGTCVQIEDQNGSWLFTFNYDSSSKNLTVEKGSITVNGVSLTVVNSTLGQFSVAIIPYTFEHTNFSSIKKGDQVNLEFDIIGKYVTQLHQRSLSI